MTTFAVKSLLRLARCTLTGTVCMATMLSTFQHGSAHGAPVLAFELSATGATYFDRAVGRIVAPPEPFRPFTTVISTSFANPREERTSSIPGSVRRLEAQYDLDADPGDSPYHFPFLAQVAVPRPLQQSFDLSVSVFATGLFQVDIRTLVNGFVNAGDPVLGTSTINSYFQSWSIAAFGRDATDIFSLPNWDLAEVASVLLGRQATLSAGYYEGWFIATRTSAGETQVGTEWNGNAVATRTVQTPGSLPLIGVSSLALLLIAARRRKRD